MEDVKAPASSTQSGITRRSLLKWTALAAAGTAALGTTGCAGFNEKEPLSETGGENVQPKGSGFPAAVGPTAAPRALTRFRTQWGSGALGHRPDP